MTNERDDSRLLPEDGYAEVIPNMSIATRPKNDGQRDGITRGLEIASNMEQQSTGGGPVIDARGNPATPAEFNQALTEFRLDLLVKGLDRIETAQAKQYADLKSEQAKQYRDIKDTLEGHYVTQAVFDPVQKLVYGLVALILIAVVGAIVALVLKK